MHEIDKKVKQLKAQIEKRRIDAENAEIEDLGWAEEMGSVLANLLKYTK